MKTLFVHRKGRFDKLRFLLAKKHYGHFAKCLKFGQEKHEEMFEGKTYNHPIASHLIQLNNELS